MQFEEIVLTKREFRSLKKSRKKDIPLAGNERLKQHRMIDEITTHAPGRMPIPTGYARINETGIDYLAYISRRSYEYKTTRRISVIALVVAILSLVLQAAMWLWKFPQ